MHLCRILEQYIVNVFDIITIHKELFFHVVIRTKISSWWLPLVYFMMCAVDVAGTVYNHTTCYQIHLSSWAISNTLSSYILDKLLAHPFRKCSCLPLICSQRNIHSWTDQHCSCIYVDIQIFQPRTRWNLQKKTDKINIHHFASNFNCKYHHKICLICCSWICMNAIRIRFTLLWLLVVYLMCLSFFLVDLVLIRTRSIKVVIPVVEICMIVMVAWWWVCILICVMMMITLEKFTNPIKEPTLNVYLSCYWTVRIRYFDNLPWQWVAFNDT